MGQQKHNIQKPSILEDDVRGFRHLCEFSCSCVNIVKFLLKDSEGNEVLTVENFQTCKRIGLRSFQHFHPKGLYLCFHW